MLSAIYDFVVQIGQLISALCGVVLDLFRGLADFVINLGQIPALFSSVFSGGVLPPEMLAALTAVVTTVVLLRVLGRDG